MDAAGEIKKRWATVAIHCAIVLLVFVVPDLLITYLQAQRSWTFYVGMYARTIGILIIFYINYIWLVNVTLENRPRKVWTFVVANLMLTAIFLFAMCLMMNLMPHHHHRPRPLPGPSPEFFHWHRLIKMLPMLTRDFMAIVLAVGLSVTLRLTQRWASLERKNEEILAAQRTEEIQNLRSQLSPHSIFNSLNTIYALIDIDTEQAKQALHRLSKLLRYVLYENPATVELGKEADFIRSYVELMEMRLGRGKVALDIDIHGSDDVQIAPLLFLPAVENAFKHAAGVSESEPIRISLKLKDNILTCFTSNTFLPGSGAKDGGIGLDNLRRRLHLLYGDAASIAVGPKSARFEVEIKLPVLQ